MNYHERGEADIYVARMLLSPGANPTRDEAVYDIAAYHTQQAIEKELKYILHDINGVDDTTHSFKTHNLADLIGQVEELGYAIPDDVVSVAYDITGWESSTRYSGVAIANKEVIKEAIGAFL